jgi:hypothetical protein
MPKDDQRDTEEGVDEKHVEVREDGVSETAARCYRDSVWIRGLVRRGIEGGWNRGRF